MTAAALRPGFSTRTYYPDPGGKSVPGTPLTSSEDIAERVADVTSGGAWSQSDRAVKSYELYLTISSISMEGAAAQEQPAVTREKIEHLLAKSAIPGLGTCPELDFLFADGLIGRDGDGGVVIVGPSAAPPRRQKKRAYLGWHRGPVTGLPYLKAAELAALIKDMYSRLASQGLPAGVAFPEDVTERFDTARKTGDICLPWWAWEALVNLALPAGKHPVTGRTVANRVRDLLGCGEIVMTRAPKTKLTAGKWLTVPGAYALATKALKACGDAWQRWREERRRRRAVKNLTRDAAPSAAWRELAARWHCRDIEAGVAA